MIWQVDMQTMKIKQHTDLCILMQVDSPREWLPWQPIIRVFLRLKTQRAIHYKLANYCNGQYTQRTQSKL